MAGKTWWRRNWFRTLTLAFGLLFWLVVTVFVLSGTRRRVETRVYEIHSSAAEVTAELKHVFPNDEESWRVADGAEASVAVVIRTVEFGLLLRRKRASSEPFTAASIEEGRAMLRYPSSRSQGTVSSGDDDTVRSAIAETMRANPRVSYLAPVVDGIEQKALRVDRTELRRWLFTMGGVFLVLALGQIMSFLVWSWVLGRLRGKPDSPEDPA